MNGAALPPIADVLVVIPAAGSGSRFESGAPKALFELAGQTLLARAMSNAAGMRGIVAIVVAAPPEHVEQVRALCGQLKSAVVDRGLVVAGGADRAESVARALTGARRAGLEYSIVLVHDAARALAPVVLFNRVADAVRSGHPAVIPVLPISDTVRRVDASGTAIETLDRAALRTVQTPQGFSAELLHAAHDAASAAGIGSSSSEILAAITDDAGLVERLGCRPHTVLGEPGAMKITRRHDVLLAESMLCLANSVT